MPITLGFDVYGTLIDTHGVVSALNGMIGDRAADFSRAWRDKQLEYAFRRGLMQRYADFAVCTEQALEHTCALFRVRLASGQREALLALYRRLPAFPDVREGLDRLRGEAFRLYAFSNGTRAAVAEVLEAAGIGGRFIDIVSVDELRTFKPDPAVYRHFLRRSSTAGADAWLVSSNPFDVIGAVSAGMRAAWVRRSPDLPFDPWGIEPTVTLHGLAELGERIMAARDGA